MVGQTGVVRRVDLAELAKRINAAHNAFESGIRQSLSHAVEAGELLAQVKGSLPYGQWHDWLDKHFKGSRWTATGYMRIAARFSELGEQVPQLTLKGALAKLRDPSAEPNPPPLTVQEIITRTTRVVDAFCKRTPAPLLGLLSKRLRDLADEIDRKGGVS